MKYQQYPLSVENRKRILAFHAKLKERHNQFLGFPGATDFDYEELYPFFDLMMNNVGDPYVGGLSDIHAKEFEQEVLAFFANLFRLPEPDYWGYVTSGGTEGNMYSLYVARQLYPDAVVYYSDATHYSMAKITDMLGMTHLTIPAQKHGEIDYEALERIVRDHNDHPAIVVANIGTTMTEAKDDVARIKTILTDVAKRGFYIHSDAALVGAYAAFFDRHQAYDFADGADSISVSGHKFIGSPFPSGVVITRRAHQRKTGNQIAYIAAPDTTISGSRSGHSALMLWYAIKRIGLEGLRERFEQSQVIAEETLAKLQAMGWEAWRNPNALTVVMKAPPESLARKWQLATSDGWSHIICMPGIQRANIDMFLRELSATKQLT